LTISLEEEEINREIFGRQDQGGGLGKIWNARKLRNEFFKITQILTINGSQELIISTLNWLQGKLTSLFRLVFNKFFAFFCDLAIPPRMTRLRDRSRDNPFQRSPDFLYETNTFSSKIDLPYDCRFGTNLLLILSSSPHDECRNCFKIKGKMGVLSGNAEKSMLRRVASLDVQNLWKKWS
jgi:hypothetical protein